MLWRSAGYADEPGTDGIGGGLFGKRKVAFVAKNIDGRFPEIYRTFPLLYFSQNYLITVVKSYNCFHTSSVFVWLSHSLQQTLPSLEQQQQEQMKKKSAIITGTDTETK